MITAGDITLVFAACVFPIYLWSIWNLLQIVPAWLLRSTMWELLGVVAYTQVFALIESLAALAVLLVLALLLPSRFFANRFVALSSAFVFLTAFWFILLQYNYGSIRLWGPLQFLPWIALYLGSLAIVYILINRSPKLAAVILAVIKKISVLSFVYAAVSIVSLVVVVIRNL